MFHRNPSFRPMVGVLAITLASTAFGGDPCGDPAAGDCFVANATPGCDDATCCALVCLIDSFCCEGEWDVVCAGYAQENCDSGGGGGGGSPCGDPAAGDCNVANGTPGCSDAACCEAVCAVDSYCCDTAWDSTCAGYVGTYCSGGGGGGGDLPNDNCVDAIEIGEGDLSFSTVGATSDGRDLPETCNEGFGTTFAPDIWYSITPSEDTGIIVSTCNQASYDTRLAAYAGCGGPLVGCNDDGDGCAGLSSYMTFPALAGETYLIRVGGYGTATGSGTLSVTYGDAPPPYPTEITPQWAVEDGGNGHFYANLRVPEDSTFATVEALVASVGGQLASVTSAEEAAFIRDFVRVSEPGAYDRCAFGLVQEPDGFEPGGDWYWTSGEALVWTNWRAGEPNDNPAPEDFGEFYPNAEWNDCFDGDFGQVLVEWDTDPGIADGIVWETADGGNGHRYQAVIAYPQVDWNTARQLAEDAGGHLVTMETADERLWVAENLGIFLSLWEQPTNTFDANRGPLVGLENVGGSWQWITGEPLVESPWWPGEPSGDGPIAQFFSLNGEGPSAVFNDLAADIPMWSYIIEFDDGGSNPCPADFDGDGVVGGGDFGFMLTQWGACAGCVSDLDGNGIVEGPDLGLLLVQWGACP